MKRLAEFSKTTLIGGVLVILPIYITILLLVKTVAGVAALVSPVTALVPAVLQFREVIHTPLPDQAQRAAGQAAGQDHATGDANQRLLTLILDVNVWRTVIGKIHANVDAEESRDDGH